MPSTGSFRSAAFCYPSNTTCPSQLLPKLCVSNNALVGITCVAIGADCPNSMPADCPPPTPPPPTACALQDMTSGSVDLGPATCTQVSANGLCYPACPKSYGGRSLTAQNGGTCMYCPDSAWYGLQCNHDWTTYSRVPSPLAPRIPTVIPLCPFLWPMGAGLHLHKNASGKVITNGK